MTATCVLLIAVVLSCSCFAEYVRIDVGEVTLNVRLEGNPKGTPVVMVHGFPEAQAVWDPVLELLSQTGDYEEFHFIVPDMRGYNTSDAPPAIGNYTIHSLVSDLYGLINATSNGEPVFLLAHDWGGLVSWAFVHWYPHMVRAFTVLNCPHPDVIKHLLLTNTDQEKAAIYLLAFIHHPYATAKLLSLFDFKATRALFPPISETLTNELVAAWSNSIQTMVFYYPANTNTESSFSFANFTTLLPSPCTVNVTTMFMWGAQDPAYLMLNADRNTLAQYVQADKLTINVYPNSGHFMYLDNPTQVAADLHAFINKN